MTTLHDEWKNRSGDDGGLPGPHLHASVVWSRNLTGVVGRYFGFSLKSYFPWGMSRNFI